MEYQSTQLHAEDWNTDASKEKSHSFELASVPGRLSNKHTVGRVFYWHRWRNNLTCCNPNIWEILDHCQFIRPQSVYHHWQLQCFSSVHVNWTLKLKQLCITKGFHSLLTFFCLGSPIATADSSCSLSLDLLMSSHGYWWCYSLLGFCVFKLMAKVTSGGKHQFKSYPGRSLAVGTCW